MMNDTPIGTICAFAGQVSPATGQPNDVWSNSGCGSSSPQPGGTDPNAPVTFTEANGWMLCDGRFLAVADYPELFAVLGYFYGQGNTQSGADGFRIPDYRGLFLRGADAGAGMDPQADERISPVGVGTLNAVGSLQCDAFEDHTHSYDAVTLSAPAQSGQAASTTSTSRSTTSPDAPARFGPETRPKNVAVNYLIKYR